MAETNSTKNCPYCGEQILFTAIKCKHCGEWLNKSSESKGNEWHDKGSDYARGVSKGLKEKELSDTAIGIAGVIFLAIAIGVGRFVANTFGLPILGWIVGIIIFIAAINYLSKQYYKE